MSKPVFLMKMAVFWDFATCSLVENDRGFRGTDLLIALMMEAVSDPEPSVIFYQTTWRTSQNTVIFIPVAVRT
jgi:hypothetical protein